MLFVRGLCFTSPGGIERDRRLLIDNAGDWQAGQELEFSDRLPRFRAQYSVAVAGIVCEVLKNTLDAFDFVPRKAARVFALLGVCCLPGSGCSRRRGFMRSAGFLFCLGLVLSCQSVLCGFSAMVLC